MINRGNYRSDFTKLLFEYKIEKKMFWNKNFVKLLVKREELINRDKFRINTGCFLYSDIMSLNLFWIQIRFKISWIFATNALVARKKPKKISQKPASIYYSWPWISPIFQGIFLTNNAAKRSDVNIGS